MRFFDDFLDVHYGEDPLDDIVLRHDACYVIEICMFYLDTSCYANRKCIHD